MNENKIKYSFLRKNVIVLRYVFKFCPELSFFAFLFIIASVVASLSQVMIISEATKLVENASQSFEISQLIRILLIYIIVFLFSTFVIVIYHSYINQRYRNIYQKKILYFLFSKVKKIDMESYDNPEFFDRFSRAIRDSTWRGFNIYNNFVSFIASISVALSVGIYVVITDVWLIVIIFSSAIINVIFVNKINKMWFRVYKQTEEDRRYYWYVNRTFYQQRFAGELKTTSISDLLIDKYHLKAKTIEKKYRATYKKLILPQSLYSFSANVISQGGTYAFLGYKLFKKTIQAFSFTAVINAALQFSTNFSNAISIYTFLKENALYIDDFLWVLNYEPTVEKNEGFEFNFKFNKLELKNLVFSYPGSNINNIDDLSLTLKKGERIAIVGHNGGGKTTLMKLLLRFYNLKSGNITINEQPYLDFHEESIRKLYSIVFQDFQIYALSIAENVLMRKVRNQEDENRVWQALKKVGLDEKIASFPLGIKTPVTREFDRDGASFSGGERQRLAIARVFASEAEIYILDEPTASLDPLAEEQINKLILKNADNKTMIIIAHRLSTVVDADRIYLIKDGKIAEMGNHQELMANNSYYAKMFNTQKSLYQKK